MIKTDAVKEMIERRTNRREALEPPQDPAPIHENHGTPMHTDQDGLEYEPDVAPTSAEEDNDEIDLS